MSGFFLLVLFEILRGKLKHGQPESIPGLRMPDAVFEMWMQKCLAPQMVDSEFGELNSDYLGKWKWDFPSELIYLLWTHLSALNSFICSELIYLEFLCEEWGGKCYPLK